MATSETEPRQSPALLPIREEHPGNSIPVLFSDGISSAQFGREVVRCYLSRFDPNLSGSGSSQNEPVAQVVLPTSAFLQSVAFMSRIVDQMVHDGIITAEYKARFFRAE